MKLYGGIDLHSNNSVLAVIDACGEKRYCRRLPNDVVAIHRALEEYRGELVGIAIESTFNWYWLVDGLIERGYTVHLANTCAIQQYRGLKHTDDDSDALFLGELLRLGILPQGYIYPRAERAVRDLARKRAQLVQQRTRNILSVQGSVQRYTGRRMKSGEVKALRAGEVGRFFGGQEAEVTQAVATNVSVRECLDEQIAQLEKAIGERVKVREEFEVLQTIPGVGPILATTIMLETGAISRFAHVGNFSSYCRCVDSKRLSNGKKKGAGNTKNGNRYLAWAFVEAANFAIRYSAPIASYYQRKRRRTNATVAIKTVAHKLARASYHMLRTGAAFDVGKTFG